ncbi:beta strand repeat-containing protein [Shewanella glacialipiscicola]|uniref:beta strand repeat-containing protein n=1 Tax=Shewanella glacialipiscicola TaxID=614069 RepID=UPI003D79093C
MSTTLKAKRLKTAQDIGAETPLGAQAKADAALATAKALSASADAKIKSDAALDATQKANAAKVAAESTAQTLAATAKAQALVAAATDATSKANAAQTAAEAVAEASAAAAKAEAISSAIADATTKSNKAKTDAISAAALDAQTKADLAKAAAINIAATDAQNKANAAKNSAISAAATDAQTKADLAKAAAIAAASTDAQGKVNTAVSAASIDAQTKADLAKAAAIAAAFNDATNKTNNAKSEILSSPLVLNESYYRKQTDFFFENGLACYSESYIGSPDSIASLRDGKFSVVKEGERGGYVLRATGTSLIYSIATIPVDTAKRYKVRFKVKQLADGTGSRFVYAGVATLDKDFAQLTGGAGTHRYCVVGPTAISEVDGWRQFEGYITGEGDAANQFRPGTAYVRVMCIVNYNGGTGTADIDELSIYEVTDKGDLVAIGMETSVDAQAKADAAKAAALSLAAADAQTKADLARAAAISSASTDAQTKADLAKAAAISAASTDAQAKANAAKSAAISTASTDAQAKADAAKAAALNLAAADAKSKADLAKNDAISAAAADAQTKANLAKAAAISAASTDATNKSNAAKSSAIATAATDATSKSADALAQSKDFTFDSVKKWTQKALVSATVSAELLYNDGTPLPEKFPGATAVNSKLFVTAITTGTGSVTRLTGILQYSGTEWKWEETSSLGTGSNHPRIDIVGGKPMYSTSHDNGYTVSVIIEWANVSTHIVTADFIQAGAVRADSIEAGAIIAGKLAANSVATANLIANAITADKIVAGAIIAGKLAANSVAAANLVANAVTADKIVAGAIVAGKLAANSVVTANLVANAITSDKIVAGAITAGKLAADSVVAANISAGEIGASHLAAGSVIAGKIAAGAIVAADIKSGTITGAQIAANTITTTQLAANSVTAAEIAANAVTSVKIAANQINAAHIIAGSITAALLAADSVTAASIKAGSIAASHLAVNSVLAASIKAGQISTAHLVAGAVTADTIAASAITSTKIAANAITASAIAAGAIGTDHLSAGSIDASKIKAGAITAAQIATGTITASQLAANSVTTSQIAANAVTSNEIASNSIISAKIAANAITAAHVSAGSIEANQIASNAIIAVKIAAGAITADKIAANQIQSNHITAGAITSDKINVTELSAISATMGEVVGGAFRTAAVGEARAEMASPSYGSYWFAAFKKGDQTPVFSVNRDGSLGMAGGTIKEYMLDPTFLDTVYRIKKDAVSGGGAASGSIPSFTVGARSTLTPIMSAGGKVTLSIVGGGSFSWGTGSKTGGVKPNITGGISVTLGLYQNNTLIISKVFEGAFLVNSTYKLSGEINIDFAHEFTGVASTTYNYELRVLATSAIVTAYKTQFQIVSFSANEPVVGNQEPVSWNAVVSKPDLMMVEYLNGYRGMTDHSNGASSWVRTTVSGIIPYQSGVSSAIGTSSWRFASAYINSVFGNLIGNADTATRLATARSINGVAFDGSANITIADNTKFGNAISTVSSNDWNALLTQGAYPVANATGANKPDGYGYGTALNFSNSAATSGVKAQVYLPHNVSDVGNTSDAYLPRYRSGYNADFGRWRTLASTDWANSNLVGKSGDSMSGALTLNSPNAYSATAVTGLTSAPLIFPNVNVGTTSKFLPMTHMSAQYRDGYVTHLNTGLYKSVNSWGDTSTGYYIALGGSDSNPTSNWLMTYSGHLSHTSGAISTQAIIASGAITAALFIGPVSGNAGTATKLATARTIAITGAVTGTATAFDGSGNIAISATAVNASNLNAGTVPDARISGSYTGLANLTGSGTVDFSKFLGNAADTVAAPSFSWTGDLDTGMYWVAADQIGFATGGVQRALFNSNGITASTFNGSLNGNASTATSATTATTASNSNSLGGVAAASYVKVNGNLPVNDWIVSPGHDANTTQSSSLGFTYANNAPHVGPLVTLGSRDYVMQFNSRYGDGGAISWRGMNGDNKTWGAWKELYHTSNLPNFIRADRDHSFSGKLTSTSRDGGIYGTYDSTKTDHIWSMGAAYRNAADGSNFGNLYGFAYKHTNNTTGGTMGGGHQAVWVVNGTPKAAMGEGGIWTIGTIASVGDLYVGGNAGPKFASIDSTDNWSYLSLKRGGATIWDIAQFNGGVLQFRTAGTGASDGSNAAASLRNDGTFAAGHFVGNQNVGGTGAASHHPSGVFSQGTNWLYGQIITASNPIDAGTGAITCGRLNAGYDSGIAGSVNAENWFRSNGQTGWYSSSYGGGIYMIDPTWVRTYGGKKFYVDNPGFDAIQSYGGVQGRFGYNRNNAGSSWISQKDSIDVGLYSDSTSTSSYAAMIRQRHATKTWTIGGLGDTYFGIFSYYNSRTENGVDGSFSMDVVGNCVASGTMVAKSWGTGNANAKVMTWDDFLPANPPAGLQGVITANWLAAGVVQAKHLQVDGISENGGVRTSFKLQPAANVPIRFSVIDGSNNLVEDIFAIDNKGNGFFKGKLSKNTVDINAIDEETRKMINPYYLTSTAGSKQELTASVAMASGELVSLPTITSNGKTNVSWKLNLGSETYSNTGSHLDFSMFQWRVDIYRGQTTTPVFSKTYDGYSATAWDQASVKFKTVISLNIEDLYIDTDPAAAKIFSMRVTKISGTTNAISRKYFGADSPNFITNDLDTNAAGGFSWTDKETGFTVKSGSVSVAANTTLAVTYTRAFSTPYSCSATAVSLMTNEWASASNGIMGAGGIAITNHADRTTTINWIATGYTG